MTDDDDGDEYKAKLEEQCLPVNNSNLTLTLTLT